MRNKHSYLNSGNCREILKKQSCMLLADIKNGQKHDSNLWANFGNNQQETISKQSVKKIYLINTYLISKTLTIKIDLQNYCCPSKQSYI